MAGVFTDACCRCQNDFDASERWTIHLCGPCASETVGDLNRIAALEKDLRRYRGALEGIAHLSHYAGCTLGPDRCEHCIAKEALQPDDAKEEE